MVRIVLTGGPSGGKTTIAASLQKELGTEVVVVPEAASMLFAGGFPRREPAELRRYQQRAIYFLQRELEGLLTTERSGQLLLCDRGSLDGAAYWPQDSAKSFFEDLNTNLNHELSRYDWILHLDTADREHYEAHNPLRPESYQQALQINEKIRMAWKDHPRRLIISNRVSFLDKVELTVWAVRAILDNKDFAFIKAEIERAAKI